MKIVALVPLKAHSERVPKKNFRCLAGKPLYRWILDSLLAVEQIDKIVINTDAETELHESGFVETDRLVLRSRRPELRGDMVSMNRIIADDIEAVNADLYLMTHVTNPLISADTIRRAIHQFLKTDNDSLFSVTRQQTRFYRADGSAVNHDPNELLRTQDLTPWYEENSCLYLFSRSSFSATSARIGHTPLLFETPKLESIDIDEPEDWVLASALAETRSLAEE